VVSAGDTYQFDAVLARYRLIAVGTPVLVADSVSNENFRVETGDGPVFLKLHRATRTPERLAREQAAIVWAGERGVPVSVPLPAADGSTLVEWQGRWWSLYPWIGGRTYQRGSIGGAEAAVLGALQGQLHRVLADHPIEGLPANSELAWDTATSLADLALLDSSVEAIGTEQERGWVRRQRELLESGVARGSEAFSLAVQATHGDFHERNVMLSDENDVLAVVDWERFCAMPPVFEVLRAVSFMLLLYDDAVLSAYLAGYRREAKLREPDVLPAVEAWWQSAMHNTWALRDFFLAGNAATRQFLPEEEFRSRHFNDAAFRERLAEMFVRYAC
jgi:homoserine kinase type II